jgi:hypothetical protein
MFTNLESLTIREGEVDFKSLLSKIRCLNYLALDYNYIKQFDDIYT